MDPVLVVGRGIVLDSGRGPELCVGAVAMSYPPQCGGPRLVGWTWPDEGTERAGDVTWSEGVALVGRYDGTTFTLVRTLTAAEAAALPDDEDAERDLSAPCPEPVGGWVAPDPGRATERDLVAVSKAAHDLDGYADSWIDDRGDRRQRPDRIVFVVRVARDREAAERALRAVWGGSLCVSVATWTDADLSRIQHEVAEQAGMLEAGVSDGVVGLRVTFDDGTLQRRMDATYGIGVVRVSSALTPVPASLR